MSSFFEIIGTFLNLGDNKHEQVCFDARSASTVHCALNCFDLIGLLMKYGVVVGLLKK